jgi:hypothetical protein
VAIIIDDQARAAIAQRRAKGHDSTLFLRVEAMRAKGWLCRILTISWDGCRWSRRPLTAREVDDILVVMEPRIARYTQWRDVTITAWKLGPFTRLVVDDEPAVMLEMDAWEQTHPLSTCSPDGRYGVPAGG